MLNFFLISLNFHNSVFIPAIILRVVISFQRMDKLSTNGLIHSFQWEVGDGGLVVARHFLIGMLLDLLK